MDFMTLQIKFKETEEGKDLDLKYDWYKKCMKRIG